MTECGNAQLVEGGCPLEKCKFKNPVGVKELSRHFNEDCTKIDMQCSNCKERMRRPFVPMHNCSDVYESRLDEEKKRLADAQLKIAQYEKMMRQKEIEAKQQAEALLRQNQMDIELRDQELELALKNYQKAE